MIRRAVFTSCNLSYIDRAKVLSDTVSRWNHGLDFFIILSDYVDQDYLACIPFAECVKVISSESIGIANFPSWSFQHGVIELCTAVKACAFQFLVKEGYKKIIYLDPDIACFSSLDFLFEELSSCSIILTPHQLTPSTNEMEIFDNELASHIYGQFNLGFLGIRSSQQSFDFLSWWATRLYTYCRDDTSRGMFTDQKWCDSIPAYFYDHKIIRHPGCNVASWNLFEREISTTEYSFMVNNEHPLVFYHFTKYFGVGFEMTKRYAKSPTVATIWNWYGSQIMTCRNLIPTPPRRGRYDKYYSGRPISMADRIAHATRLSQCPSLYLANPYDDISSFGSC